MATQTTTRSRAGSTTTNTHPHSLSLKVLRLSKPTFAVQTPLPATNYGNGLDIDTRASLAYPTAEPTSFPLSPVLTLPKSFGLAYVGEKFGCTLCVNDETASGALIGTTVSGIKVNAELQTPSNQRGVPLTLSSHTSAADTGFDSAPGDTIQFNIEHELSEAGQHVLAVTVAYTESKPGMDDQTRIFRKLYQFVAQQLISIRSKVTQRGISTPRRWIIEAQIENLGETAVMLSSIELRSAEGIESALCASDDEEAVSLKPADIQQVMFLTNESGEITPKRRLGQIIVGWSGSMGETGQVKTGWLTSKS